MSDEDKKLKIEIAPGAFDFFEGSQEELDELMASLEQMVADGSFLADSVEIDMDALAEEDPELYEILMDRLSEVMDGNPKDRKLN